MKENIQNSFKDFMTALQTAKLYGLEHPITGRSVKKAYLSLRDILSQREELVIGIIGEELAFEKEIFFDLSKLLKQMIIHLKERGIERISFNRSLYEEELSNFIAFLVMPKEEIKGDLANLLSRKGIKNISVGRVGGSGGAGKYKVSQQMSIAESYQNSLNEVSGSLTKVLNRETLDGISLKLTVSNIINNLSGYYQQSLKLITLKRYDEGTFVHLMNVSILSMYFSSRLGFSRDVVLDIGVAALLHDLGKLHISRKVIRKTGKLSPEEFAQIESHTVLGAKLLTEYVEAIGFMPAVVSFEHHIKYDLSGYPKLTFSTKQHIASSIVSICDVYDALSERRSYKADYPPEMIYDIMIKGKNTAFDPVLLEDFFKVIGVWPLGSLVMLSDKRVAVVAGENKDSIFLPIVRVIHPEAQKEVIDLKDNKLGIKIERYLNPWTEGKDFLHLV